MKNVDNLKLWCLFRQRLSLQGEQNIVSAIDNALGKLGLVINSDNEIVSDEEQGEHKPVELKTKAGNWYVCDMEVMNENMATAFHRDEIYYCPKDGYLDVSGALFEVGSLDVFRLATEKEIPQSHWKPSDEQMEALDDFIYAKYPNVEKHGAAVKSLYQDLKKLREE